MADERREISPPPRYTESTSISESKNKDTWKQNQGPWLVRRTSIHIESTTADAEFSERSSMSPSEAIEQQKGALRGIFRKDDPREVIRAMKDGLNGPFDSRQMGTRVTIEATQPIRSQTQRRIELKGLEQAASAKRWTGGGRPAEAWGKLMKDPELWDENGDTFVYFGYSRPNPSFRIKASLLEETKSDHLISKLQDGYRQESAQSTRRTSQTASCSSKQGIRALNLGSRQARQQEKVIVAEVPIRHEIHFPASSEASRLDILRHHLTTRNLFALLMNKTLVGLTFYQALVDLQERLEDLIPGANSAQVIMRYLIRNRLHNVTNDPAAAAGLLAWSEDNFWQEGWREGYVHCTGMYPKMRTIPEFRDISHVTRMLLERSNLEIQVRVQETEDRLATFRFDDMWPARRDGQTSVPASFNSFRRFLSRYYEKTYKSWPPRPGQGLDAWLTRDLAVQLQIDFGALYNYYVDQDIVWDDSGTRMIHRVDRSPIQHSNDTNDFSLGTAISVFDHKYKYLHLPHPCPLLPPSISVGNVAINNQSRTLFASKSKALEKQILAASSEASNAILLGPEITGNPLVEALLKLDKSDRLGGEDPRAVRKARWLMLYGILQVLSNVVVDTPHLWFKDGATYLTNPRMKGMPPWKTPDVSIFEDAGSEELHRWLIPKSL